jgi:outer membrane receptor protein involved in Fe transport
VNQIYSHAQERTRGNIINEYDFSETSLGLYLKEDWLILPWLEFIGGLRFDYVLYDGSGTQDVRTLDIYTNLPTTLEDQACSFDSTAETFSPKLSLIISPVETADLFLNYGEGFCSSEARRIANFPSGKIPKIRGAEIGTRLFLSGKKLTLGSSLWWAEKEKEMVFDPNSALSSERGESRRLGAELEIRYSPLSWVYLGTDLYYINSRFVENNNQIPYVPTWIMTNSLSFRHSSGIRGSLRGRLLGPRFLAEGIEADSYYIVDFLTGYDRKHWGLELAVDNLLNTKWEDSTFYYNSRPDPGGEETWGVHYTPGTPLAVRLSATAKF